VMQGITYKEEFKVRGIRVDVNRLWGKFQGR
jgi:hypothetical protein